MKPTKVLYKGKVRVLLDTDDESWVEAFERDCKWDHPLLKLEKEKKSDAKAQEKNSPR
jgi:acylphosphatase